MAIRKRKKSKGEQNRAAAPGRSDERLKSILELSSDWYWEQDENYRFTLIEGANAEQTGSDAQQYLGTARWDYGTAPVGDGGNWDKHKAALEARQPFTDFIFKRPDPRGGLRYVSSSGQPVFDGQARFRGYRGIAKDVTARMRSQQLLALEHAVNRCLADARSAAEAIKTSMRVVCEIEGWECGRYFRMDEKAGLLRFADAWGIPDPSIERYITASREVTYAMGAGMTGKVWQSGEPLWASDYGQHAGVAQATFGKARDVFIFPLIADGKAVGVCTFISSKLRPPDERLLQAVRVIGSQIGQFLQRKQAEDVLRESEARFRSLTDLSSDWFWEQDAEFRFTRLEGRHMTGDSSAFTSELGKTRPEIGVEVESGWEAHRALLEAHRPFRDVIMWRTAQSGHRYYMSVSGEPMFDNAARFIGYRGVGKDITARRHGEELLALEHAVNRCLADADNVSTALKAVICVICEAQSWAYGRYFRLDKDAGVLRFEAFWSAPGVKLDDFIERSRDVTYTPGQGLAGKVWQSGEPLWVEDVTKDPRMTPHALARGIGLRGTFLFPATAEGQVVGVLTFICREVREPDARLLQAVRVIGSQIGQFVQRKHSEHATLRIGRMFAALSATNDAILHTKSPEELYQRVCAAAVHGGKFSDTTIFIVEQGASRIKVVAGVGRVSQLLALGALHVSVDETIPEGRGLVGIAIRTRRPCVSNDFLNDERTRPWHEIGRKADCRSAAALPLIQSGRCIGAILIHYEELNAFDDEIVKLLERMAENISFALDNIERDAERRSAQERVEHLASHDLLTSLPNRLQFSETLNLALQDARRYHRGFAVLFIDLDHFKIINDTLGHEAGDQLLKKMGTRLRDTVRSGDAVARLGGDEFVVLVQEVSEVKYFAAVAHKILSALIKPVMILGQECRVTASIGICIYPADAQDEQALMKHADIAMYRAKELGKNNFQFYTAEMNAAMRERMEIESGLRRALEEGQFVLHYQPRCRIASGKIVGVEALIRWRHPQQGIIPPAKFISVAEESGLIVPIGEWVLRTACSQVKRWREAGAPELKVAVNLSARQFQQSNLLGVIQGILEETGLDPRSGALELELTESMVMRNVEESVATLTRLHEMGLQVSIDDFGTGYSSLSYLRRFAINTLKIDQSFVRDITTDPGDAALASIVVALGHSLKLNVIAEGVETVEQLHLLQAMGCDEAQGFYLSKPLPAETLEPLLRGGYLAANKAQTSPYSVAGEVDGKNASETRVE